jgi:hypothetical protein
VAVKDGSGVASTLALGTVISLSRFFATMVVLFFLLVAGDRLLRGFIEVLPRFSDKRQACGVEIALGPCGAAASQDTLAAKEGRAAPRGGSWIWPARYR